MHKYFLAITFFGVLSMGAGCQQPSSAPMNQIEQKQLTAEVSLRMKDDVEGQDVALSGVVNDSFFIPINALGKNEALITGKEVGRKGYYWAGAQYDLIFIKSDATLQIQQEVRGEFGDVGPRKIIKTLTLPSDTEVMVK